MYAGPFLVIEQISPVTFLIQKSEKADPLVVHVDKLKLTENDGQQSWLQPDFKSKADEELHPLSTDTPSIDVDSPEPSTGDSNAVNLRLNEKEPKPGKRAVRQPRWLSDYEC
jgi:hypothetical protein